jgi:hypothetical protein
MNGKMTFAVSFSWSVLENIPLETEFKNISFDLRLLVIVSVCLISRYTCTFWGICTYIIVWSFNFVNKLTFVSKKN